MRRLTLEQRITRLENAIKASRSARRKFESMGNFEDALRGLVEHGLEGHDCYVVASDWHNNGAEIDIQDDMGDTEYYDDWESNYATYRVTFDGRKYNVSVDSSSSEDDLGVFSTLFDAAKAILKDRGIG